MALVTRLALASALTIASPAHADELKRWGPQIEEASVRFGVPTSWIERVMRAESSGRTTLDGRPIRSYKGAIGLMQLMPATWAEMRERLHLGTDPDNPRDNIFAGTFYLRLMYERFGYPGLFAAYNAGPGRYAAWLAGRERLPAETLAYLSELGTASPAPATDGPRPRLATLFVVQNAESVPTSVPIVRPAGDMLFAIRKAVP